MIIENEYLKFRLTRIDKKYKFEPVNMSDYPGFICPNSFTEVILNKDIVYLQMICKEQCNSFISFMTGIPNINKDFPWDTKEIQVFSDKLVFFVTPKGKVIKKPSKQIRRYSNLLSKELNTAVCIREI